MYDVNLDTLLASWDSIAFFVKEKQHLHLMRLFRFPGIE